MRTPADLGWGDPRQLDYASMVRWEVWPGHIVSLRNADVGVVMAELVRRLRAHSWPGPDAQLDEWGYARRLKRWAESAGQTMGTAPLSSWSDHAWATAIDLDTAVNPMYQSRPANPQAHTSMPVAACPAIASALGLEWGGSWDSPWDPQHWQVAVSPARLHQIADGIRNQDDEEIMAFFKDKAEFEAAMARIVRTEVAGLGCIRFIISDDNPTAQWLTVPTGRAHLSGPDLSGLSVGHLPLVKVPSTHWLAALPIVEPHPLPTGGQEQ